MQSAFKLRAASKSALFRALAALITVRGFRTCDGHLARVSKAATIVQAPMQTPEKKGPQAAIHASASC